VLHDVRHMCRALASLLIALTITASAGTAWADAAMRAFVAEVVRQNPTLSARVLRRSAASREAAASGLWPDPEAQVMVDNLGGDEVDPPMVRFQLSQMIPWPGKLGLMEDAALRRTDAAGAEVKSRRLELELEAKRAYLMLALNAAKRRLNQANRGLVKTIANAALARYSAGAAGHHEVARAQVELNAIDVEAIALGGERVSIVAMMNALRNQPAEQAISDPAEPVTTVRMPAARKLVELAVLRRPELEGMRAMQREEEAMAALARRERYPDLMAGVWYNQMIDMPEQSVGMMVGTTIPVFGVRRQTRLGEAAGLRGRAALEDLAAMRAMIRFEVADALRKVTTARRTLEFVRGSAQPHAQESFLSSLAGYSSGTVEITGLLESWRALQATELARVEAALKLAEAVADLERVVGGSWGAA
jgi:outer membrane protein, heavy metal efflux system